MRRLIIPVAVLVLGILAFWWFSPTQVLKRHTSGFIETANVPPRMSDIGRSARGRNLEKYFAPVIRVDSPEDLAEEVGSEFTRERAVILYSSVARYCREISIAAPSFESVEIDGDLATVLFTADALVDLPNRRPVDGLIRVESEWRKVDGDWLLEAFRWSESGRH